MKTIQSISQLLDIELKIKSETNKSNLADLNLKFNSILKGIKKEFEYKYKSPNDVINIFIKFFKYPEDFATSKSRKRETYVAPRQMCQVMCREIFKTKSLETIGSYFTNGDHATILHSVKVVSDMLETNEYYREMFNEIQMEVFGFIKITYDNLN